MSGLREELTVAPREGDGGLRGRRPRLRPAVVSGRRRVSPSRAHRPRRALALLVFLYGFLVSYVYGDAKRRGMRYRLWAVVAALVPNALGFIAYFLLREPLLRPCGACGASARRDFAFCPQCGSPLARPAPRAGAPWSPAWTHCAHCGTRFGSASPAGA